MHSSDIEIPVYYLGLNMVSVTSWILLSLNGFFDKSQVMAVDMSYRLGWIDESIVMRVQKILIQAKLPTAPPETMTVEMFKSVMAVR